MSNSCHSQCVEVSPGLPEEESARYEGRGGQRREKRGRKDPRRVI